MFEHVFQHRWTGPARSRMDAAPMLGNGGDYYLARRDNHFFFLLLQTRACLEELMQSDEDMLGLLLTEAKELRNGEVIQITRTAADTSRRQQ